MGERGRRKEGRGKEGKDGRKEGREKEKEGRKRDGKKGEKEELTARSPVAQPDVYRGRASLVSVLPRRPSFPRFRYPVGAASGAAIWLMAAQPGSGVVAGSSPAAPKKSAFWSCFSCRMVTGGGLLASGVWVYMGVRRSLRQRRPGTVFDVFRLAFAIGNQGGGRFGRARFTRATPFCLQSGAHSPLGGFFCRGCNDAARPPGGSLPPQELNIQIISQDCIGGIPAFYYFYK